MKSTGPYIGMTRLVAVSTDLGFLSAYPLLIPSLIISAIFTFSGIMSLVFLTPQFKSQRAQGNFYRPLNTTDGIVQDSSRVPTENTELVGSVS